MNNMFYTYLVVKKEDWESERSNSKIGHFEMDKYGFIHSSTVIGLAAIIDRFLIDLDNELVLTINAYEDEVTYEDKDVDHLYPHFYHLIDLDQIVDVTPLAEFMERGDLDARTT